MTVFELLQVAEPIINNIISNAINPRDVRYVDLYKEYLRLSAEGHKKTYIEAALCEMYTISRQKYYNLLRTFGQKV